ncbi:hypothetical protein B0H13DRAFT_1898701, partial [Mycena leptocephala]
MGCILSGAGFGGLVMAPVLQGLLDRYGVRTALRILAAWNFAVGVRSHASSARAGFDRTANNARTRINMALVRRGTFLYQALGALLQAAGNVIPLYYMTSYSVSVLSYSHSTGSLLLAINSAINSVSESQWVSSLTRSENGRRLGLEIYFISLAAPGLDVRRASELTITLSGVSSATHPRGVSPHRRHRVRLPSREEDSEDEPLLDAKGNPIPKEPIPPRSQITLAGLLNVLDYSVASEDGRLTFATTNRIEQLDPDTFKIKTRKMDFALVGVDMRKTGCRQGALSVLPMSLARRKLWRWTHILLLWALLMRAIAAPWRTVIINSTANLPLKLQSTWTISMLVVTREDPIRENWGDEVSVINYSVFGGPIIPDPAISLAQSK